MTDTTNGKRLIVHDHGYGPYIFVSDEQLPDVRRLLEDSQTAYSVQPRAISLDDGPFIKLVRFKVGADAAEIQRILDQHQ